MRTTVLALLCASALAVGGCSVPDSAAVAHDIPHAQLPSAPGGGTPRSVPGAEYTFMVECIGDAVVQRPRSFVLACGDGNESLDELSWRDWGSAEALARGEFVTNSCDPTCANGRVERYPVAVTASELVNREAGRVYARLSVTFLEGRPDGTKVSQIYPLPH